jgi:predicted kinase
MSNLYVLCGAPGSGKSTFAKEIFPRYFPNHPYKIISRDAIRFSLLKDGEEYFSHENEVYQILWESINQALKEGFDVISDQTSLNPKSRAFLLQHISGYEEVIAIEIKTPLKTCLARNNERIGKTFVPPSRVKDMYYSYKSPTIIEGFSHIYIYDSLKETLFMQK